MFEKSIVIPRSEKEIDWWDSTMYHVVISLSSLLRSREKKGSQISCYLMKSPPGSASINKWPCPLWWKHTRKVPQDIEAIFPGDNGTFLETNRINYSSPWSNKTKTRLWKFEGNLLHHFLWNFWEHNKNLEYIKLA